MKFPSSQFDDVVAAVCAGLADADDLALLAALLVEDSSARDEYLLRVELHARLASEPRLFAGETAYSSDEPIELMADDFSPRLSEPMPRLWELLEGVGDWAPRVSRNTAYVLLGGPVRAADRWSTAAALLVSYLVFYGAFFSILWSLRPLPVERDPRQAVELAKLAAEDLAKGVATLVETSECDWEADQPPAPVGGRVTIAQTLRLRSGQAVLRFDSGAEIGLVGPVVARAMSPGRLRLEHGRLAAHIPARATGFTVETALARLVDLGTDFAVDASESGETKMTVTRGAVEVISLAQVDGAQKGTVGPPMRVTAGQSVTVFPEGKKPEVERSGATPEWTKKLKLHDESTIAVIAYQTANWAAGNYGDNPSGLGQDFDVLRPIQVEALGVFDDLGDGFAPQTELTVQLWSRDERGTPEDRVDDRGGKVLAELRFNAESQGVLMAGHRFKSLATPLALPPGAYSVVAYGFSKQNRNVVFRFDGAPPRKEVETWRGSIVHIGARYGWGGYNPGVFPSTFHTTKYPYVASSFKFKPLESQPIAPPDAEGGQKSP